MSPLWQQVIQSNKYGHFCVSVSVGVPIKGVSANVDCIVKPA